MKQLPHIISKLFYEPAVITPARHGAICQLVEARLANPGPRVEGDNDGAERDKNYDEMEDFMRVIGNTAIINVHGTLVAHPEDIGMSECGCAMEDLSRAIDLAEYNTAIERVIYDFRTPGGVVTAIPETARKILNSSKRTVGFTGSECNSGGIWLASACERFYGTGSSRIGSVGVYTMCLDMSGALKKDGIKVNAISAGKYKLLGAYWKPLAKEEEAILQKRVDKIYAEFKQAMEARRVVNDEHFGNGLVFDGEEAAQIGFTDGVVDDIEDILDGMVE